MGVNSRQVIAKPLSSKQQGMTMLELLIVIVMVAILASMAVPSFNGSMARSQLNGMRANLASAMQLARSEALKRKSPVTVCTSNDQDGCSGSTDWQDGWIIFADTDGNGSRAAGEQLLQVKYSESRLVTYQAPSALITFDRIGRAAAGSGDYSLCHPNNATVGKKVTISVTGSIARTTETIGGC